MITPITKEKIKEHALSKPMEEVCGFVFDDGSIYKAENISGDKGKRFSIAPISYVKACDSGQVFAIYHSHIGENYNFSEFDKFNSDHHKVDYLVYSIGSDKFNFYRNNSQVNKYSGKDFKIGENDCYSLVYQYYLDEFGYSIRDNGLTIGRQDDWLNKNPNIFNDIFELNRVDLNKFSPKTKEDLCKGDILVFNYFKPTGFPHHLGIYLGDDYFLHHPRRKFSLIEQIDDLWLHWIVHAIRLK